MAPSLRGGLLFWLLLGTSAASACGQETGGRSIGARGDAREPAERSGRGEERFVSGSGEA